MVAPPQPQATPSQQHPPPPPASSTLASALDSSTREWRNHLQELFEKAKERFADVVWELGDDDDSDEVWGHKAIVYARAPPSFQARYFKFRPAPTPNPYGASPIPNAQSNYSLSLPIEDMTPGSRSPSPFATRRVMSPAPSSTTGQVLRISTNIAPALFTNELEYLYTGKGLSDAFEFLFDSVDKRADDDEGARVDKLRNDLIYMWRSRLYSDIRVVLEGNFPSGRESYSPNDVSMAAFSSHRFILVSRSQYFRDRLQSSSFALPSSDENEIKLPSPPFTPASVHFTLGFIYTGTLSFSHRTFDLTTAFHIYRAALYLQLDSLQREIQARIVEEMSHGLFHAFLPFDQYEKITAGRWGVGGCKCKQCQRRAPRVLEFAMAPDVNDPILTRGAQRALSGMFGEGWCQADFASLAPKTRSNLVKGVSLRTNAMNVIPLLFAAQAALTKLENNSEAWAEEVREMVHTVRKRIDDTMCTNAEEVFEQEEWLSILERDGAQFSDNEKVGWIMDSLIRGLNDKNAGMVYQTVVSAILLRADPNTGHTVLPMTSVVRASVERARLEIARWIGRKNRWQYVHAAGGFEEIDGWAVKEISDEIDVPVEALLAPRPASGSGPSPSRSGLVTTGPHKIYGDSDSASISSFHSGSKSRIGKEPTPSVHSISRGSVNSTATANRPGPRRSAGNSAPPPAPSATSRNQPAARLKPILSSRVQSTVSQPSNASQFNLPRSEPVVVPPAPEPERDQSDSASMTSYTRSTPPGTPRSPKSPLPQVEPSTSSPAGRPKSLAPSVTSVRSTTSTIRRANAALNVPSGQASRPTSSASTSFRTAKSEATPTPSARSSVARQSLSPQPERPPRQRTLSTASNSSAVSAKSNTTARRNRKASGEKSAPSSPQPLRARRGSTASATSTVSNRTPSKTGTKAPSRKLPTPPSQRPPLPNVDLPKGVNRTPSGSRISTASPAKSTVKPRPSNASMRSTASSVSTARRPVSKADSEAPPPVPPKDPEDEEEDDDLPNKTGIENVVQPATPTLTDDALALQLPPGPPPPSYAASVGDVSPRRSSQAFPSGDVKGKGRDTPDRRSFTYPEGYEEDLASRRTSVAKPRSDGGSTVRGSNDVATPTESHRRNSSETIRESVGSLTTNGTVRANKRPGAQPQRHRRGITLGVGIPCIITSKRARFRAFARYIGEVEGETGPWIGVEVPVGESWTEKKLAGRSWNDGTVNGTRYFEISSNTAGWDDGEQRAARRRRIDMLLSEAPTRGLSKKREGDALSLERERLTRVRSVSPAMSDTSMSAEVRGLFVRPQQVLYVVDAEH
ncbi:hypothetical protein FRC04_001266 [Tulasnella sp. 424]|nr:hypothetical protein FRC04_001266 [Tulasnella sp. 424]